MGRVIRGSRTVKKIGRAVKGGVGALKTKKYTFGYLAAGKGFSAGTYKITITARTFGQAYNQLSTVAATAKPQIGFVRWVKVGAGKKHDITSKWQRDEIRYL